MKRLVLPPLGKTIKSWRHLENRPPALVVGLAIPVISDCLWKHHQTVRQCVCLFFSVDGGVELRMNSLKTIPQQRQRGREWMETNNKICSHNSKIPPQSNSLWWLNQSSKLLPSHFDPYQLQLESNWIFKQVKSIFQIVVWTSPSSFPHLIQYLHSQAQYALNVLCYFSKESLILGPKALFRCQNKVAN